VHTTAGWHERVTHSIENLRILIGTYSLMNPLEQTLRHPFIPAGIPRAMAAGVMIAGTVGLAGCSMSPASGDATSTPTGPVLAFMVDQSCDASDELTASAVAALPEVVDATAQARGTFMGEGVTTGSYQRDSFSITHDFATDAKNAPTARKDLRNQADDFLASGETKPLVAGFKKGTDCGSDLINALASARRAMKSVKGSDGRAQNIVFVTNGVVIEPNGVNFVHDNLTPAYIKKLIDKKEKAGLLADLSGVDVQFVSLGVLDRLLPAEKIVSIENFWKELATRAGAKSVETPRSGSQLSVATEGE
jgi:hypothetical protein